MKVRLATPELRAAMSRGRSARMLGASIRANPFMPSSDGELWRAWNLGYAGKEKHGEARGTSNMALYRRRRAEAVLATHGEVCWLCHKPIAPGGVTMDHVIPRSKGGPGTRDNLRPAHASCNARRGNGPPPELLLTADMVLSPRSNPVGGNPTQIGVPCEARERDQRQLQSA